MGQRSSSTINRDHQRAIDHKAYLKLQEIKNYDWETVEDYELTELRDELDELESEVENEEICEQIRYLLDLLDELD